jgi:hypothetical protein
MVALGWSGFCLLACGFLVYVFVQFWREGKRPPVSLGPSYGSASTIARKPQLRVFAGGQRAPASSVKSHATGRTFGAAAILLVIALFPGLAHSQEKPAAQSSPAGPGSAPTSAPASPATPSPKTDAMTEPEKYLLAVIERLENRVAKLEARLADKPVVSTSGKPGIAPRTSQGSPSLTPSAGPLLAALPQGPSEATPSPVSSAKPQKPTAAEPFAFADFTWLNGTARTKDVPLDTKFFTPEIRSDIAYIHDFNHPADHTIGGSSEVFRSGEIQVTQLGVGGDFHSDHVIARFMTQFGWSAPRKLVQLKCDSGGLS